MSVMVRVPVLLPTAVGLKVTLTVQLEEAERLAPQVFVSEKSPLMLTPLMLSAAAPVFLSVTLCALLLVPTGSDEKVSEVAERLATGPLPVPVRLMVWVAGLALSVRVTEPVRVPVAVGLKVTLIEQEEDAATLDPQVFVSEKLPLAVVLVMLRGTLAVFLRVTLCALLLEPIACAANVKDVAERLATGTAPVPLRLIVWVVGLALSVIVIEPLRVPVALG